jgi:hypothetical protein
MSCVQHNSMFTNCAVVANRRRAYGCRMTTPQQDLIEPAAHLDDRDGASAPNHAFFMLVLATPEWLQLTPPARFGWLDEVIRPLLAAHPGVSMRFFDSEAFNSRYSDVLLWETSDVLAYQALVEELRETAFWGTYFEVVEIVASIENAYAIHYKVAAY